MHHFFAAVVGADEGADQQHRGAGGAHEAGQHGTYRQNGGVQHRAAVQVAPDVNATGHGVQRGQQDDERDVLGQHGMHHPGGGHRWPEQGRKRQQKRQRPTGRHLAEVVVPKHGRHQRHQGDRQQDTGKRHAPQHRQRTAVKFSGLRQRGQKSQGQRGPRFERQSHACLLKGALGSPVAPVGDSAGTFCVGMRIRPPANPLQTATWHSAGSRHPHRARHSPARRGSPDGGCRPQPYLARPRPSL